jgi:hypothetical protein
MVCEDAAGGEGGTSSRPGRRRVVFVVAPLICAVPMQADAGTSLLIGWGSDPNCQGNEGFIWYYISD